MTAFTRLAAHLTLRVRVERQAAEIGTLRRALRVSIGENRRLQAVIDAAPGRTDGVPLAELMQMAHDLTMARFRIIELEETARAARH